uniref:CSN8/PSMD8/EIF3K domain-containing protein n=1 Tax=Phaeocystis cordata TaxID=118079 RepID=A0A6T5USQ4_9EUKA
MDEVRRRLAAGQYAQAARACEDVEIDGAEASQNEALWEVQIACKLIAGDTDGARFSWKRMPDRFRQGPQVQALGKVLETLWRRDFAAFHREKGGHPWCQTLQPLMAALSQEVHAQIEAEIQQAYSTIALQDLCALLAISREEGIQVVERNGWTLDGDFAHVVEAPAQAEAALPENAIHSLTKYVVHLDSSK